MTRSRIVVLLLLFVVVWFAGLDDRALTRPDEGRYSEIPREMAVTGDWVTPRLNGLKYFEKPPLQYWASAFAYNAFDLPDPNTSIPVDQFLIRQDDVKVLMLPPGKYRVRAISKENVVLRQTELVVR